MLHLFELFLPDCFGNIPTENVSFSDLTDRKESSPGSKRSQTSGSLPFKDVLALTRDHQKHVDLLHLTRDHFRMRTNPKKTLNGVTVFSDDCSPYPDLLVFRHQLLLQLVLVTDLPLRPVRHLQAALQSGDPILQLQYLVLLQGDLAVAGLGALLVLSDAILQKGI
jgi:hypothetical protein